MRRRARSIAHRRQRDKAEIDQVPGDGEIVLQRAQANECIGRDIVPLHLFALGLSNIEAIIGQSHPATLLARLVTLQLESRRRS
ncbi:MAG: hypothetical protein WAK55_23420 [Xanthobacteraceae bacterium]